LRNLVIFGLILALLLAGCTTQQVQPTPQPKPTPQTGKICRNITEQIPIVSEVCENVSYTENICGIRKLNYSTLNPIKIDLCISEGACSGMPLGDCPSCQQAMSRCMLIVQNKEDQKSGMWSVGANFTIGTFGFNKDPITSYIGPNENHTFDFNQIYVPGDPISSAVCSLSILSDPTIEECHQETRPKLVCRNETVMESVQKEVCQ